MVIMEKGLETTAGKVGNTGKQLNDLGIQWRNADGTMMNSTQLLQSAADWLELHSPVFRYYLAFRTPYLENIL